LPLSVVVWLVVSIRNLLYDFGLLKTAKLGQPVIGIGNLTTGGTGKTPLTHAVTDYLLSKGCKPAILSRGYKSEAEKSGLIFRAAVDEHPTIAHCGDEVAMLAEKLPGVWFGVGADRIASARRLSAVAEVECFVLDDSFQHRKVDRDLNIVIIDASIPFGNRLLLPAGILRESLGGLKRADLLIISRCESASESELAQIEASVRRHNDRSPVIRASTSVAGLHKLDQMGGETPTLAWGAKVWALAATANPAAFRDTLQELGCDIIGQSLFPDHHRYTPAQIAKVVQDALANGAEVIVTTEKDATKLSSGQFSQLPCLVVEIGFDFGAQADIFWGIIDEVVQC
jgi:tetraacyldisaccharide 4'-kinase